MLFRQRYLDIMKGVANLCKRGLGRWPDNRVDLSPTTKLLRYNYFSEVFTHRCKLVKIANASMTINK